MGEETSKYQKISFSVGWTRGGVRTQVVHLDCCNVCGAVVGNRPAHDIFCHSEEGEDEANYR